jgi:hypothetical protein
MAAVALSSTLTSSPHLVHGWMQTTAAAATRRSIASQVSHHASFDSRSNERQPLHYFHPSLSPTPSSTTTRLYSSSSNDEGFFGKIGKAIKKVLPTELVGTPEEKDAKKQRQIVKQQVTGTIDEMFKGAPLGVRMIGKMIGPMLSTVAATMEETMAEQQKSTQEVMDQVQFAIQNDSSVRQALGEPIRVGPNPISQSSSMSSINGQTQTRIDLILPITGSMQSGMVRVSSANGSILQLTVETSNGRRINVNPNASSSSSSSKRTIRGSFYNRKSGNDNVIEAEIIEKDTK